MDQTKIVDELIAAAESAGITIREAALNSGDVKVRSGLCTLRGEPILFLDPGLTLLERAMLISSALRGRDLDNVYLSPAARALIEGREPAEIIPE
ncbi:MAG TPA: hypothetical protein VM658_07855 [bacterium]|nr:hypothetical protein [bacterium]